VACEAVTTLLTVSGIDRNPFEYLQTETKILLPTCGAPNLAEYSGKIVIGDAPCAADALRNLVSCSKFLPADLCGDA
jgi:hypothetical protein